MSAALSRTCLLSLVCALALAAQPIPVKLAYDCTPEDIDAFGLSCTDERPCPVYLELTAVEPLGSMLFATGNLHTQGVTMYGVLLASEDGGKTWAEPIKRIHGAVLEQIRFLDFEYGWATGNVLDPLPRTPFLLLTTDGGKTWRKQDLVDDLHFGRITQFWFESRTKGELVLDASQRSNVRMELYQTSTGGQSWEIKATQNKPIDLPNAKPRENATWRIRADAAGKIYRIERGGGGQWEAISSFSIALADCHQ